MPLHRCVPSGLKRMQKTCFYVYSPWGEGWIQLPILGRFHVLNALAAISVAGAYGISFDSMQTALKHMPSIPGRLELIRTFNQRRVFIDYAYAGGVGIGLEYIAFMGKG